MKKIIIILIIILVILVSIVGIVLVLNHSRNSEIRDEADLDQQYYLNGLNNPGLIIDGMLPEKVNIENIYFTVVQCIKEYLQFANENNNQALYSLLDYKYINEHNITQENVNQLFRDVSSNINKTIEEYSVARS